MSTDVEPSSLQTVTQPGFAQGGPVGNTHRLRHGLFSTLGDGLSDRAHELAELILREPHVADSDLAAVASAARLAARVEAMDADLNERGMTTRAGKPRGMVDLYLRGERRLQEALDALGMTPRARAAFTRDLMQAGSLADDIRRRREEAARAR